MENDFHIKKIRAKERVTFQNEGKYQDVTFLNKRDKVKCVMQKRKLYAAFPKSTKGVGGEKKSGHCESSSQFLMILKELHPDKILLIRTWKSAHLPLP